MNRADFVRLLRRAPDAYFSNRKLMVATVLILIVLLYWYQPWRRSRDPSAAVSEAAAFCRKAALRPHLRDLENFDIAIVDCFSGACSQPQHIPFIGNGHAGLSPLHQDTQPELRIRYGPSLRIRVLDFDPLVHPSLDAGTSSADAYVTDYRYGTVTHFKSYALAGDCITITTQMYFHRKYPSILMQEITVKNPSPRSYGVTFSRKDPDWKHVTTVTIPPAEKGDQYKVYSSPVPIPNLKGKIHVLSAALPPVSPKVIVEAGKNYHVGYITGIDTSEPASQDVYSNHQNVLEKQLTKAVGRAKLVVRQKLYEDHAAVWRKLSESGISISYSRAPNVLNPDLINATIYYVLSNTPAPLFEDDIVESGVEQAKRALFERGQCYSAHSTSLYPSRLWPSLNTIDDIVNLASGWKLTLEKGGCGNLFDAGVDGLMQAIVMSFGEFKHTHRHLEFRIHPKELSRDYGFRGLLYNNSTSVDVAVEVGADNKAIIYASIKNLNPTEEPEHKGTKLGTSDKPSTQQPSVYACDAGCLDQPIELTAVRKKIPVKLTEPLTPILYVTSDLNHLKELKHTIHVKEVGLAPAHENHVIAMHKHGHRLGGLPTMFWVSLVVLVTVFHLFLFKLVYNEYCAAENKPYYYQRGRYAV